MVFARDFPLNMRSNSESPLLSHRANLNVNIVDGLMSTGNNDQKVMIQSQQLETTSAGAAMLK